MKDTPAAIPPQWTWHYATLLKVREQLLREHDEHSDAARAPREAAADVIDIANAECEHRTLHAELSHEEAELVEVDAALARLRSGTFGVCEATGMPIAADRLRAIPWTRFCQAAAKHREQPSRSDFLKI
jgi:DnaK suppressor protein